MKKAKKAARRVFNGRKPFVIRTKFPTSEEIAAIFGMSVKRVKKIKKIVGEVVEKNRKEEELLREALRKLNRAELGLLRRFVKSEDDRDYLLLVLDELLVRK